MPLISCQNLGSKNVENRCQNDPSKIDQKIAKISSPWGGPGVAKNVKNRRGGPGGSNL
jgi:hypothetical protein